MGIESAQRVSQDKILTGVKEGVYADRRQLAGIEPEITELQSTTTA